MTFVVFCFSPSHNSLVLSKLVGHATHPSHSPATMSTVSFPFLDVFHPVPVWTIESKVIHNVDIPPSSQARWIGMASEVKDKLEIKSWMLCGAGAPFISHWDDVYAPTRYFGVEYEDKAWETDMVVELWEQEPFLKEIHQAMATNSNLPLDTRFKIAAALKKLSGHSSQGLLFHNAQHIPRLRAQDFDKSEIGSWR